MMKGKLRDDFEEFIEGEKEECSELVKYVRQATSMARAKREGHVDEVFFQGVAMSMEDGLRVLDAYQQMATPEEQGPLAELREDFETNYDNIDRLVYQGKPF